MTKKAIARKTLALVWFTLAMGTAVSLSQSVILEPRNARTQADYVIICPSRYVSTVQPLATFRQSTNGFTVAIVTTEAIYNVFGQGIPPDSAIKSFIGFDQLYRPQLIKHIFGA
jgi:hypothetical protein